MKDRERKKTILIIDDDVIFCHVAADHLASTGADVVTARTAADGLAQSASRIVDVVLLDQQLPDADGYTLCPDLLRNNEQTKIIFSTAFPSIENAIKAIRAGAHDYLAKPYGLEELDLAIGQALRTIELEGVEEVQQYQRVRDSQNAVLIGGPGIAETMKLVERAAGSNLPVLITGETGTGKSLVAKAIHYRSRARTAPFISINCASLPENLIEAELFGHERGAFTGAATARKGLFEMADGGTLFLDEIGELPLHLQAKLLSVLEEHQVRRIGSEITRPVNARLMAATNIRIENALAKTFRKDLYYRLSVIRIDIPPLRERRGDIPALCGHLLKTISGGKEVVLAPQEVEQLSAYDWPGNVRELKNILDRAFVLQSEQELRPSELLCTIEQGSHRLCVAAPAPPIEDLLPLEDLERLHIRRALTAFSGNQTRAAKALGISLSTLKRKIKTMPKEQPPSSS